MALKESSRTRKVSKPVVTVIPEAKGDSQDVSKKQQRCKPAVLPGGAVIYVGHIPHGFYEEQMKAYFSQFGEITRLRLSRNKRTGKSKHYAFIEFKHSAVAEVVAETMNNYLLFNQLLQVKVLPADKVHDEMFKGANRKFRVVPWGKMARERYNAEKTEEQTLTIRKRAVGRKTKLQEKLKALGIEYDLNV